MIAEMGLLLSSALPSLGRKGDSFMEKVRLCAHTGIGRIQRRKKLEAYLKDWRRVNSIHLHHFCSRCPLFPPASLKSLFFFSLPILIQPFTLFFSFHFIMVKHYYLTRMLLSDPHKTCSSINIQSVFNWVGY